MTEIDGRPEDEQVPASTPLGEDQQAAAPEDTTDPVARDEPSGAGADLPPDEPVAEAADDPDQPSEPDKRGNLGKSLREWGLVVIIAITAAVLMKVFVIQQFYVSGHSMDTTLHDFDRVLVNKLSYKLHDPNRGDVVVLEESVGIGQRDLIKRVIALPGETIEMRDCVVYIDGRVLDESAYLDPDIVTPNNCGLNFPPITIPEDHVWVMGDNRPGSGDSRQTLGPVDYDQIVGRAFVVIWPKDDWQWL